LQVIFRMRKLEKQYCRYDLASKAYGQHVARKYIQRIGIIKKSQNFEELERISVLKCHPLKGNRKGQWAISLTGFYRLIFTLQGNELKIVKIEEVSKHYDD
jgi:proteic killer suppression protein